jgi:hypothetical protein
VELNVWTKSSRSGNNGQCVEVRDEGDIVAVRDSKHTQGPILTFAAAEWTAFINAAKNRGFDRGPSTCTSH